MLEQTGLGQVHPWVGLGQHQFHSLQWLKVAVFYAVFHSVSGTLKLMWYCFVLLWNWPSLQIRVGNV